MGDDNKIPAINALSFFDDPDAIKFFAKLDYQLKDGVHFQDRDPQRAFFQFLKKNEASLRLFYDKYYEVRLDNGGEGSERYYFLDFYNTDRGKIDGDHRNFLRPEYVIVGFLLYKIIFIDRNFELNSVRQLQMVIKTDYEELKKDISRLLAKLRRTTSTTLNDKKISDITHDALTEFKKLGWITLNDDFFDVLPSFSRLPKLYGDYINNIDEWIKNY